MSTIELVGCEVPVMAFGASAELDTAAALEGAAGTAVLEVAGTVFETSGKVV